MSSGISSLILRLFQQPRPRHRKLQPPANYRTRRGHTRVLPICKKHHHHHQFQKSTPGRSTISLRKLPYCVSMLRVVSPTISVLHRRSYSRGSLVQQWVSKARNRHRRRVLLKARKEAILMHGLIEYQDYHHQVLRLIYRGLISIIFTLSILFSTDQHSANGSWMFANLASRYTILPPERFHYFSSLWYGHLQWI